MRTSPNAFASSVDDEEDFDPTQSPEEFVPYAVADQVVKLIVGGSLRGQVRDTIDPDLAIDGVLMGLAMVIEQAQEFPSPSSLRRASDQFGRRLASYAKAFRQSYEETGVHVIDHVVDRFGQGTSTPN